MSGDFVETVRIENFGCARDASLELTRLHALIGPNDSGKSTVLSAIRTMGELIRLGEHRVAQDGRLDSRGVAGSKLTMGWGATEVVCRRDKQTWTVQAGDPRPGHDRPYNQSLLSPFPADIANPARGATLARWDPDAIRRTCELIPEGSSLNVGEKGEGLLASL